jgi:hypothetical protein
MSDPRVPVPFGPGNEAAAGPTPPLYGTKGSAVPWKAMTGTGRLAWQCAGA